MYDRLWREAMTELRDLLRVEDPASHLAPDQPTPVVSYSVDPAPGRPTRTANPLTPPPSPPLRSARRSPR